MKARTTCFLLSLLLSVSTAYAEREGFVEIVSHRVDIDVSRVKIDDEAWTKAKPYRQPLQPQFLEVPKPVEVGVQVVLVRSINDGKFIAFRLEWEDATNDDAIKIMNFSDAAAIQFPVDKQAVPQFFMGEGNKSVHILYWRAWRSRDEKSGFQTTKSAYPNMTSDIHTFDYPVKGIGTEKTQTEKDIFTPGRAAKNPLAFPRKEIVEELSSTGPGTITTLNTENTSGAGIWENGQWTVIFRRPLAVSDVTSVQFKAGERMPIAFAVWEGSRMEVGLRKAVSPAWAELKIEK